MSSASDARPVPALAHFLWSNQELPWFVGLAIYSALARGGFERVVLHCDADHGSSPWWPVLAAHPRLEVRRIEPDSTLAQPLLRSFHLLEIYQDLREPAARANLLRAALLATEGGVYLDTDTVTLTRLDDLRTAGVFCGEEHVAFPGHLFRPPRPGALIKACGLDGLRAICTSLPNGVEAFRRIEPWFGRAVNNAVLGARPEHPFMLGLLERMARLPTSKRRVRFALGTHLLQAHVAASPMPDLVVHPPEVFYPLGPVLSRQWFRQRPRAQLTDIITPATRVVHWYASVRVRSRVRALDAAYVHAHANRELFSELALPLVREAFS